MVDQFEIRLPVFPRGIHLITHHIEKQLNSLPEKGIVNIFIKHTSAGLTISENADPKVRSDLETFFDKNVPENEPYSHSSEGVDDMPAHIKSVLSGAFLTIPVTNGRLNLGTWQGIYLCEFRNYGGSRKLLINVIS